MQSHVAEGVFGAMVDSVVGYLADGVNVHLVGPHGSGRSELLGLVSDRLDDDGYGVLRLYGAPGWRAEAFGTLLAAGIGPANAPGPRRSVGEMTTALTQQLRRSGVIVVVDDADEVDGSSVGALLTAHHQRQLVAFTASRPHRPLQPDSLRLGLAPAVRLRMPVLDVDQVHDVVVRVLDGPVDAAAVARITTKSGGLHGLVHAITAVGRRTGTFRLREGVWTLPGDLWVDELAAAVEPFLAGADREVWEGATALAATGPISYEEAEKLLGGPVLDRLLTAGLVHHSDDSGAGVIGIFPPLLAEYLRHEGSASGLARARALTDWLDLLPAGRAYATAGSFDPGLAVGADAAVLDQRTVREAAEDVARLRRAWELDPSPSRAMPLLVAMRTAATPAPQLEHVVRETPPATTHDAFEVAKLLSWHAMWQAVDQGRLTDALTTLDRAAEQVPAQTGFLEVVRAHLVFLCDRVPDVGTLPETEEYDDAELLGIVRAELLLTAGLNAQAQRLLADFRPSGRVATGQATLLSALADVFHGDLESGIDKAQHGYLGARQLGDPGLLQAHAYVAILGLGISGRLADAAQLLFRVLSSSTLASFRDPYRTGILVLGAEIAVGQGRPEYARALATQAGAARSGRGPFPGMDPRVVTGMLGEPDQDGLWQLVEDRIERGYLASAVVLAVEAVEHQPDIEAAARVSSLGATMEGRLLPALAAYVEATAADDESALASVAEVLTASGAVLYGIRADVTRCLLMRRTERASQAATLADEVWQRSAVAGLERSGLFERLRDQVALSGRELEILQLLVAPMSTSDVAGTLQTSVRTVESHVHNASRKLGTSGREQLLRAATTWLRPPPGSSGPQ